MERQDLTATSFVTSRLVAALVGAAGLFLVFRPRSLGWDALVQRYGHVEVTTTVVGCMLLLLAAHSFEKHQLRVRVAELTEMLHQLLYGKDYAAERDMIDVLIGALGRGDDTAYRHLQRLTGQNFADDPAVWQSWWAAHRRHFKLVRTPESDAGDQSGAPVPPRPREDGGTV